MNVRIVSMTGTTIDAGIFCTIRTEGFVSIGEFNHMRDALLASRSDGESYTLTEKDGKITLTLDKKGDTPG